MRGELVKFATRDGLELPGFYVPALTASRRCAIFIHGLTGTFLWPSFVNTLGKAFATAGWNLLAFNNRGADIITGFAGKTEKWVIRGGALERFKDCAKDIAAVVSYAQALGNKQIVLIGHSTGCQKSVYYQAATRDRRVKGLVLLAPASDVDAEMKRLGKKRYKRAVSRARQLVKSGKARQLLGNLSAARYWALHKPNSIEGNIFNYRTGRMPRLSLVHVPILAVYGSRDKYSVYGPRRELAMLGAAIKTAYAPAIIKGAGHNFERHERTVAALVGQWLRSLK